VLAVCIYHIHVCWQCLYITHKCVGSVYISHICVLAVCIYHTQVCWQCIYTYVCWQCVYIARMPYLQSLGSVYISHIRTSKTSVHCVVLCCSVLPYVAVVYEVPHAVSAVRCSVLQRVAVCCSLLQLVAVLHDVWNSVYCCSKLQRVSIYFSSLPLQCVAMPRGWKCSEVQYIAVCCSMLQYVAVCCSVLQSFMTTCRRHTKPNGSAHKKYRYRYNIPRVEWRGLTALLGATKPALSAR